MNSDPIESTPLSGSTSLTNIVGHQAAQFPDSVAILAPGRPPLTYGGLHHQIVAAWAALNRAGVGRGDCVGIVLPNGPELAVTFLSVIAGAVAAPLNPAYRAEEFEFYLADLGAKALIALAGSDSPAVTAAKRLGIALVELSPLVDDGTGRFDLNAATPVAAADGRLAAPDDVALVLHTSGTTSRPKQVPLTQLNLAFSARNICRSLTLTPADRCLNVMPLFHIHGLMAALASSLVAGASVVCTPGFFVTQFFDWLEEFQPTWYTAVPAMHQAILARASAHQTTIQHNPLRFMRSSSAPLPPRVMADLETAFAAPMVEAYGMTEAAHQIAINSLPPGRRVAGSVGHPANVEVTILDEMGRQVPPTLTGEIAIRGPNVTAGYANNPAANTAAFTAGGWFRTGDWGFIDKTGYIFITGRIKEMINRGGEKVAPREIEEVLLRHPAVGQAVTFAIPDARLGEEIGAAVVVIPGHEVAERALRDFAAQHLAEFKVPRRIVILEEIPKGPTGKPLRIGLAKILGIELITPVEAAERVAPRDHIETVLARIWREVLRVPDISVNDRFADLGGDSMLALLTVNLTRERLNVDVTLRDFFDTPTIAQMAEVIRRQSLPETSGS